MANKIPAVKFQMWIAWRYFRSKSLGAYALLLRATAVSGVAVGILSLILVMSIMRGFRIELTERLTGFDSHITISEPPDTVDFREKEIQTILKDIGDGMPFVQGEVAAVSTVAGNSAGARLKGIDLSRISELEGVELYFPDLEFDDGQKKMPSVIVGHEIASQISVHPDFGDTLELMAPMAELLPNGELGPKTRQFRVAGVFKTGIYNYDGKYIFADLKEAKKLLGLQARTGWQIKLRDLKDTPDVLSVLRPSLPAGWSAAGWNEQNKKLFAALKLERVAMTGVLLMVVIIASFAIFGIVFLVTSSKRKDIAILESLGLKKGGIGQMFLFHAAFIGAIGSAIGFVLGTALCLVLEKFPISLPASYYLEYLPVDVNPLASVIFVLAGIFIAIVSSVYPVRQAVSQNPVEVLRYE